MLEETVRRAFRILFIIDAFKNNDTFECELGLQKIEFFLRNPDHFVLFLIREFKEKKIDLSKEDLKVIIKKIILEKDFEITIESMEKYRFGAFENLNMVYTMLISSGYIQIQRIYPKKYLITQKGKDKVDEIKKDGEMDWYFERLELLKKFLKSYAPTEIKNIQYKSDLYRETLYNEKIPDELENVKKEYKEIYEEDLVNE